MWTARDASRENGHLRLVNIVRFQCDRYGMGPLLRFLDISFHRAVKRDEESESLVAAIVSLQLSRDPSTERAAATRASFS